MYDATEKSCLPTACWYAVILSSYCMLLRCNMKKLEQIYLDVARLGEDLEELVVREKVELVASYPTSVPQRRVACA
eukprot:443595-Rhodomonas_salina.3